MEAIRFEAVVPEDGVLKVFAPDLHAGDAVEIIVLRQNQVAPYAGLPADSPLPERERKRRLKAFEEHLQWARTHLKDLPVLCRNPSRNSGLTLMWDGSYNELCVKRSFIPVRMATGWPKFLVCPVASARANLRKRRFKKAVPDGDAFQKGLWLFRNPKYLKSDFKRIFPGAEESTFPTGPTPGVRYLGRAGGLAIFLEIEYKLHGQTIIKGFESLR
jgi:hypothetical protein